MLTIAQITAENISPVLTEAQVLNLVLLVKNWPTYRSQPLLWPDVETRIRAEIAVPTVKTQALKAVLTALGKIPKIVVESSGTADSQSHFSSVDNWDTLSSDVLDILYDVPIANGRTSVAVIQRTILDVAMPEEQFFLHNNRDLVRHRRQKG